MNHTSSEPTDVKPAPTGRKPRSVFVFGAIWAVVFFAAQLGVDTAAAQVLTGAAWLAFAAFSIALGVHTVGGRGFGAFAVLGYVVVLLLEACSVAFGVPFGFFSHNLDGPRILDIPLFVPVAYIVFGWPAWLLARLLTGGLRRPLSNFQRTFTPVVATFVLASWDLHYDAISSTVEGRASYGSPSGFMGVPLTNFVGWLATGWVVFTLWALLERHWFRTGTVDERPVGTWVGIAWALLPFEVLPGYLAAGNGAVVVGGREFVTADVYEASFVAGLLSMTTVGLIAIAHLWSGYVRQDRMGTVPEEAL
ncbi:carotenoid biosynthesis protein [Paenarthrobacter nicotinovorans]|uniref:carotenoid biosynthesis protein n=1 Tax=Paenarthrobacter nicotinovorans TaxID=29320 RepID=UPI0037480E5A